MSGTTKQWAPPCKCGRGPMVLKVHEVIATNGAPLSSLKTFGPCAECQADKAAADAPCVTRKE